MTNESLPGLQVTRRTLLRGGLAAGFALAASACGVTGASGGGSTKKISGVAKGNVNALFMKQAGLNVQQIGQVLSSFKQANGKISVAPSYVAYEALHDKIVTSAAAGTYDVVLMDVIWPAEFATKNIVLDVSDKYPSDWTQKMLGGALTTAEYKNKFYGVPWYLDSKYLYYNKAMLKQAGVKESALDTWDGVLQAARKIKASTGVQHPIAWSWAQAEAIMCDYTQLLGAWGGDFLDSSGKLAINKGAGVESVNWMVQTIHQGLTNPASATFLEEDVQKTMAQGQAAFGLNWASTWRDLTDPSYSKITKDVAVVPTPKGPSGKRPGCNGGMAFGIPTKAKNPSAGWKLVTFMTSPEQENRFADSALPSWKASYQDPKVRSTAPQLIDAAQAQFENLMLRPTVPSYNDVSQIIQVELQNALLGKKSPQAAMDDAVGRATKAMND